MEIRFYLGTYTNNPRSKGIYTGTLDTHTGGLGPITLAAEADSPTYLTLSPDRRYLYASTKTGGGAVAAFRIKDDKSLDLLNELSPGGDGACHVWVDSTGKTVFVANYAGGSIATFQVAEDGSLAARRAFVEFNGSGPNEQRQEKPHAHFIRTDPQDRFVYVCDLGTDSIWIYRFDASTGALISNDPPRAPMPPGSGPRHLALHPHLRFAYVNGEMGHNIVAFKRDADSGALTQFQTVPTLPPDASGEGVTTAAIFCHPSGKWLYVSNRGHDSITVYSISDEGRLTWLDNVSAGVKGPRDFRIEPTGQWLISAGQNDHRIVVFKIDQATGRLTPTDQSAAVGAPVCVLFLD